MTVENLGPAGQVSGNTTLVFLLLNEVRHRILARLFGVSRRDSNLMTMFAIGSLAGVVGAVAARLRPSRPRASIGGSAIGAAVFEETAHGIAGESSRSAPLFSALILLVLLEKSFGPTLRASMRGVRGSLRGVRASLRIFGDLLEGR
jgi:ABC-type uncharacterized transport system permease subunit